MFQASSLTIIRSFPL